MDSNFGQIAIPLAAAGISAYAPRRGGAGVQGALAGLGAVSDFQMNKHKIQDLDYIRQRHQHEDMQHDVEFGQHEQEFQHQVGEWNRTDSLRDNVANLIKSLSGDQNAAGGNMPGASQTLQANALEQGAVPKPHTSFQLNPYEAVHLQTMPPEAAAAWLAQRSTQPSDADAMNAVSHLPRGVSADVESYTGRKYHGQYAAPPVDPSVFSHAPPPGMTVAGDTEDGRHISRTGLEPNYHFTDRIQMVQEGQGKDFQDVVSGSDGTGATSRATPHIVSEGFDPATGHSIRRDLGPAPPGAGSDQEFQNMAAKMAMRAINQPTGDPRLDQIPPDQAKQWLALYSPSTLKGQMAQQEMDMVNEVRDSMRTPTATPGPTPRITPQQLLNGNR